MYFLYSASSLKDHMCFTDKLHYMHKNGVKNYEYNYRLEGKYEKFYKPTHNFYRPNIKSKNLPSLYFTTLTHDTYVLDKYKQ